MSDLPSGFVLDQPTQQSSGLPDGFVVDEPKAAPTLVEKAVEPITSYPETQSKMANEAVDQMARGVGQLKNAKDNYAPADLLRGITNVGVGGVSYVASPINAAIRTVVGKPVEEATGIPKEVSEFAASFALPVPKALPRMARSVEATAAQVPTKAEVLAAAKSGYRQADTDTALFAPTQVGRLADDIATNLKSANSRDYIAPQTFKAVDELRLDRGANVQDIRSTRELLGEIAQGADRQERRAAALAIRDIDRFLATSVPETASVLKTADANYSAAMSAKKLDEAAEVAGLRAGRAGYGGNAVNAMRQVLSPIVEKSIKGRNSGFRPDEIAAMREIVHGNETTDSLRLVGQFSPTKGILNGGVGAALGTTAAGPAGLAVPAIGAVANKLASVLTGEQIAQLNQMVLKRSPLYAEAVKRSAEKAFDAADAFSAQPTPANLARTIGASRALVAGLNKDGIALGSGDFLRGLYGPVPSRADQEQPEAE